jgi:2-succinyl-5-enolpyruvyl-6-hydroxy-3-cyclohexene-1-carboxylate synthase
MAIAKENINALWGSLIVEELIRQGIDYFCISPGSRSTPLTIAVARHPKAQHNICNDERAAAYLALGYAKATGKSAVVVSTSGTAVANYFPAVVEASFDLVPLIVLSADRPPELRATGANQTITQTDIFGDYVRWQFDLPCPDENISPQMVLTTVAQATYRAQYGPAGPVHLNCPLREPLAPTKSDVSTSYLDKIKFWAENGEAYTTYYPPQKTLESQNVDSLVKLLNNSKQGILIVGHLRSFEEKAAVKHLAQKMRWPIFADILSGLRLGFDEDFLISNYDLLLNSQEFVNCLNPDTILQLGGQVTSKRLLKYIEKLALENYILVTNHPFRFDPIHRVRMRIENNLELFSENLNTKIKPHIDTVWFENLKDISQHTKKFVDHLLCQEDKINEPAVAYIVSQNIPKNHALFLASSLPVREMDMFGDPSGNSIVVTANRGASGIDGTIASAVGNAIGLNKPLTLLIGDLAFLHDLNSLMLLDSSPQPILIVVINNNGGGIFSFLPVAEFTDVFEKFFATPHNYSFESAAKLFHLNYYYSESKSDFINIYNQSLRNGKSAIIEIRTDRQANYGFQKEIMDKIGQVLQNT